MLHIQKNHTTFSLLSLSDSKKKDQRQ